MKIYRRMETTDTTPSRKRSGRPPRSKIRVKQRARQFVTRDRYPRRLSEIEVQDEMGYLRSAGFIRDAVALMSYDKRNPRQEFT